MSKPKLIIHETISHGCECGYIYYNGKYDRYSYDDGTWGNARATVQELINIGFINANDVVFLDNEAELYALVEKGLSVDD